MTLNLQEILNCVSGTLIIKGSEKIFNKMSIDTRSIKDHEIFLAISGENFDGNNYVLDAVKKGIKLCIIDKKVFDDCEFENFDVSIIKVDNTLDALKNLAMHVRDKLNIDIIGVTGSVGKTTTKDLIYDFLASKFKVYKVLGNFNNHIGMPLSLINIDDDSEIGVFELGMSDLGEIDYLAKILRPNVAIITNIGENHMEFLKTRENILKAKMEIVNYFGERDVLIINNEDEMFKNISYTYPFKIFKIGFSDNCDMFAEDINLNEKGIEFNVIYNGRKEKINLPVLGSHNILNALFALKICEIFNISIGLIRNRFELITSSSMRQEIFKHNKMTIINDCYNASPTSMKCGIDVLNLYNGEKVCIFGDMAELGERSENFHGEVSNYANGKVNKLIAIGKYRNAYCEKFQNKDSCFCFESIDDFKDNVEKILNGDEIILIKASRSSSFEKIVDIIEEKF